MYISDGINPPLDAFEVISQLYVLGAAIACEPNVMATITAAALNACFKD
jgi:hypothetical protein